MAAIMADEEDEVKMDGRLIMLKASLSLRRRTAAFGKLPMLKVFVTTGNAFSMLDRSLKPVKGFCFGRFRMPASETWSTINIGFLSGELSERRWWHCPNICFSILIYPFLSIYVLKKGIFGLPCFPFMFLFRGFVYEV